MLKFLLFLLGLALILVGVLAGGCSLMFTPSLFDSGGFGGSGIFPIWAGGIVIGALGLWLGILVLRRLGNGIDQVRPLPRLQEPPEEPADEPPPPSDS